VPAVASAATFTTYTYGTHQELDADRVFVTIAILNMIRLFVGAYFGRLLEAGPECLIAMGRMRKFLLLMDVKPRINTSKVIDDDAIKTSVTPMSVQHDAGTARSVVIEVKDASFGRGHSAAIEKIDLSVAKGELVMLVGPVGWLVLQYIYIYIIARTLSLSFSLFIYKYTYTVFLYI
jgi:ABC-type multidrug transport system fused ATPase/permease subunit